MDSANIRAVVWNGAHAHDATWCHLMADTTDELVEFAWRIGLRPEWIQFPGTPKEHFDVTAGRRVAAVRAGAVEISSADAVELMEAKRDGVPFTPEAFLF